MQQDIIRDVGTIFPVRELHKVVVSPLPLCPADECHYKGQDRNLDTTMLVTVW